MTGVASQTERSSLLLVRLIGGYQVPYGDAGA
jgi:hypothetical protein